MHLADEILSPCTMVSGRVATSNQFAICLGGLHLGCLQVIIFLIPGFVEFGARVLWAGEEGH